MQINRENVWLHYGAALFLFAAAILLRLLLNPLLGSEIPFVTFFPAVAIAALYMGFSYGLFIALLGAITANLLFMPRTFLSGNLSSSDITQIIVFFTLASFISWICSEQKKVVKLAETRKAEMLLSIEERVFAENKVSSLLRISKSLNSTLEIDDLLDTLVKEAITLVNAESGVAGLYTREGMTCKKYFQKGQELSLEYTWAEGQGLPGWLITNKKTYITNDAANDKQILHTLCNKFGVHSAISVPVLNPQNEVLGFFEIHNKRDGGFTDEDEKQLSAAAQAAAIAIQNAISYRKIKSAEEALRDSEQQLRTLADTVPQLVWMADADGFIFWYNSRWYEYTGTTKEEMEGWGWQSVHDPKMLPLVLERWKKSIETGEPFEMEFPLRGADSKFRWFLTRVNPQRDGEGKIVRWFGTNTDVHEQKQLTNELQQANRLKDEFLATLSHELRTPLSAILGWARMLRITELSDKDKARALETIERNAKVQTQLVEDILDMSRIITGKLRLDMQKVNLVTVIEAALESARPATDAKGIKLNVSLGDKTDVVSGDAGRLQQVIWNLLSNAIKFTPRGGEIFVGAKRVKSNVEITVSDTGQGIKAEFLPYVFDRFRQEDSSITRKTGGLGIGLAIVRHLVELHGGMVQAESGGEGKGATFKVVLPVMAVYSESAEAELYRLIATNDSAPKLDSSQRLDGVSVLVVDDDEDTRSLLESLLKEQGANVALAESAEEGLRKFKLQTPQFLISDIGMPQEDGYSFIRKIKELEETEKGRTHTIALTAYTRREDKLKAIEAGYEMHIAKPVEPAELIAILTSLLKQKQ